MKSCDEELRCNKCNKLLFQYKKGDRFLVTIICSRCKNKMNINFK